MLAPLVDRSGNPLHDGHGAPLAADGDGLVFTIHPGQTPVAMGSLADDDQGRIILVPLADGDLAETHANDNDPAQQKGRALIRLGRRRAHLRGRIAHHQGRLQRLSEAGASASDDRRTRHLARIEQLTAELAQVQQALDAANAQALNGMPGDDAMNGLGNFSDWWVRNRKYFIGAAAGAGGALLARSAIDPDGYVGRFIRTGSVNDPAAAEAERAAAAQALQQAQAERDAAQARAVELARQAADASARAAGTSNQPAAPGGLFSGMFSGSGGSMPWLLLGGLVIGGALLLRRKPARA